jgi:hypothetical protein
MCTILLFILKFLLPTAFLGDQSNGKNEMGRGGNKNEVMRNWQLHARNHDRAI